MDNNQNQDQNINIQLNEMVAGGVYCNLALVNHSPSEFVLDFIQLMPGVQPVSYTHLDVYKRQI